MDMVYAANKAIYLIILLSAAPIAIATFIGLLIGLLQTITQIQEQTLPFGVKLVGVFVCLLMMMGWMGDKLLIYAKEMLTIGLAG
ncbi:EscS/YscS/HrcS family type III secretion system export apparatus protein [Proteus mirabilis]|uniref:EscS/YscS/HrcS family type III secretion system export apparatus protein n=5 Tax=Enterobacterales TaxID=91347 RepID=A0AAJ4RHM1_PROMI|nr:type III secretion system export apparatus subunit SctS [Proteus mirabilis]AGS61141.1 type III secretion system protein [Proteus mirabilis BB2000]EEI47304.1 type III secretion protein, HrpO family [Proteus mirabilis ATCC 29906]NBL82348.1 EscS/YscS/HrcS family type III secretion system export apparatus protein [Proteus sp. G2674]NBL93415.1 EscS/YscS/HrcS family type III secretion system export apparatus protein [Proteus sp. G2675]NBM28458.1 EscS/YscS/HrcS family type III secretion system exp